MHLLSVTANINMQIRLLNFTGAAVIRLFKIFICVAEAPMHHASVILKANINQFCVMYPYPHQSLFLCLTVFFSFLGFAWITI